MEVEDLLPEIKFISQRVCCLQDEIDAIELGTFALNIGDTTIVDGTNGYLLYNNNGVLGNMNPTDLDVTVGTTGVNSGTNTYLLYNNNGVLGNLNPTDLDIAVGTTGITGGTNTYLLYNNNGVLGNVDPAAYLADLNTNIGNTNLTISANRTLDQDDKTLTLLGTKTFSIENDSAQPYFKIDHSAFTDIITMGGNGNTLVSIQTDTGGFFAHSITLGDSSETIGTSVVLDSTAGTFQVGDNGGLMFLVFGSATANGTQVSINDTTRIITLTGLHINLAGLQNFANNAAAVVGGLAANDLYYTDVAGEKTLKIV